MIAVVPGVLNSGWRRKEPGSSDPNSQFRPNVALSPCGSPPRRSFGCGLAVTVRKEGNKVQSVRSPSETKRHTVLTA
jgi:hypothetical protein